MKRFTETTKWNDPWFRRLSERSKLLWNYITDNCDAAGLIDIDFECASFHIGGKVEEKHLTELGDRVQRLEDGKVFIPKFIPFQYGTLSSGCPAHNPIFKLIKAYQLTSTNKGYQYPSTRVQEKEKEKEKDQEGVQGEEKKNGHPTIEELKLCCAKNGLHNSDAVWLFNKWEGNGWKNGGRPIKSYPHTIAQWRTQGYFPSQKQAALKQPPRNQI